MPRRLPTPSRSLLPSLSRLAELDALALSALLWFLAKFLRYAFPPLFGSLQRAYGVSNTVVGAAFSGLMLVYALMQFPSGALADRFGAVRVVAAGALVAALGALSLSVPAPFAALVAGMALVGLGTGAHKTVAVRLLSGVYPARTGRALGVLDTLGALGGAAAAAAVVVALPDWRGLFLAGGLAGVALAAAFARRVPARVPDDRSPDDVDVSPRAYLALFGERRFALFFVVTVLFSFAYNGAVAFLPLYLTDAAGLSTAAAGAVYSALFLVSLVQLATGELSDRLGERPVIVGTLLLALAGVVGTLLLGNAGAGVLPVGAAVVAFGLGSHGFRPVRGAYLVRVVPDDVAGGSLGVVRTGLMGAGAVAPAVVGSLSDAAGFAVAFGALAAAMAGAAALAAGLFALGGQREGAGSTRAD
jgi:MFS family permease